MATKKVNGFCRMEYSRLHGFTYNLSTTIEEILRKEVEKAKKRKTGRRQEKIENFSDNFPLVREMWFRPIDGKMDMYEISLIFDKIEWHEWIMDTLSQ